MRAQASLTRAAGLHFSHLPEAIIKIKMELGAAEARNTGRSNGEKSKWVSATGNKAEQKMAR